MFGLGECEEWRDHQRLWLETESVAGTHDLPAGLSRGSRVGDEGGTYEPFGVSCAWSQAQPWQDLGVNMSLSLGRREEYTSCFRRFRNFKRFRLFRLFKRFRRAE